MAHSPQAMVCGKLFCLTWSLFFHNPSLHQTCPWRSEQVSAFVVFPEENERKISAIQHPFRVPQLEFFMGFTKVEQSWQSSGFLIPPLPDCPLHFRLRNTSYSSATLETGLLDIWRCFLDSPSWKGSHVGGRDVGRNTKGSDSIQPLSTLINFTANDSPDMLIYGALSVTKKLNFY